MHHRGGYRGLGSPNSYGICSTWHQGDGPQIWIV